MSRKFLWALVTLLLLIAPLSHGDVTARLINHKSAASANTIVVTTAAMDTTGATLMVVSVGDYQVVAETTLSDSASNTWSQLTSRNDGFARVITWYCSPCTTSATHTFSYGVTLARYPAIAVNVFNNILATPFDQQNGNNTAAGTTLTTNSVTATTSRQVIVAAVANAVTGAITINDANFNISETVAYSVGANFGLQTAYAVQPVVAAVNPQWGWTGTADAATEIATFKAVISPFRGMAGLGK